MKFFDPDIMGAVVEGFAERNEVLLQGRRTYQVSAEAWRAAGGFAKRINAAQKYVVSDTLTDEDVAAWTPTTIIRGADLVKEVSALRAQHGGDIYLYGSLTVARSLIAANLVDELVLMIEPITLGGGKTLFPTDGAAREFELTSVGPRRQACSSAATTPSQPTEGERTSTDTTRTVLRASQSRPTAAWLATTRASSAAHASGSVIALLRSDWNPATRANRMTSSAASLRRRMNAPAAAHILATPNAALASEASRSA